MMDTQSTMGLDMIRLCELWSCKSNVTIAGVLIDKEKAKIFRSKTDDGEQRAVWKFTVRDSPKDYINVCFWGELDYLLDLHTTFQKGDIVILENPTVELLSPEDYAPPFHPMITSQFKLMMNQNISGMKRLVRSFDGVEHLKDLLWPSNVPCANFCALYNISKNLMHLEGKLVDFLVSVRSVGEVRQVETPFGLRSVRNVIVFDYTCPGLTISIWNEEVIARAAMWEPHSTILFMTDMRVLLDHSLESPTALMTDCTIVTEDPDCNEARLLRNYVNSIKITIAIPDPSTINTVMNVSQILKRIETISNMTTILPKDRHFTTLLFAHVTFKNLDCLVPIVRTRCSNCKHPINDSHRCGNPTCLLGTGEGTDPPETEFDFGLTLSDETGCLTNCRLKGVFAERALNCTVEEYYLYSDKAQSAMKWDKLKKRCALRILVYCPENRNPIIRVLSCNLCTPSEEIPN